MSKSVVEPVTSLCAVQKGSDKEKEDMAPLWLNPFGKEEVKKQTLKKGQLVLSHAAFKGDMSFVEAKLGEVLMDFRGEEDPSGNTPVHWAAVKGHADVLEALLDYGFPPDKANRDGDTALHWAASAGFDVAASLLIEKSKANVWPRNKDSTTPMHFAAAEGHIKVVQVLDRFLCPSHDPVMTFAAGLTS